MRIAIRNPQDFWAGVVFVVVGIAAVVLGRDHPMGTTMRMGPAYFPTVLGILLALIGLALTLRALVLAGPSVGRFTYGKPALVLGSTALFGVLLRPLGLVAAVIVLVSAYASQRFRWPVASALAVGLAAGCAMAFVRLLGLPIPILGTWLGG